MFYEGKVYRPWIESESLLIQATIGCAHNKCTFCDMFREKRFRTRDIEDVFKDIENAGKLFPYTRSVFLIDGNVMVMRTESLLKILEKVKRVFPKCSRISLYSSFNDMRRKSAEDLKALREAGLTMAYVGLESGDPVTLDFIEKRMTPEEAIEGMAKAKEAGIEILTSIILGIGGKERSKEHIVETTKLLNILKPEQIAPMALAVQPGTQLDKQIKAGEFIQATPEQILEEERYLLENLGDFKTYYWGDHGNNIVSIKGRLPESRERFLKEIDKASVNHPVMKQEILMTSSW